MHALIALLSFSGLLVQPARPNCAAPVGARSAFDTMRAADRTLLRREAAAVEDAAIRFADSTVGRKSGHFEGFGLYDSVTVRCRATLDSALAATHGLSTSVVREYAARRDVLADAGVLFTFYLTFAAACWLISGQAALRVDRDDRVGTIIAAVRTILLLGLAGAVLGEIWSIAIEVIRIGNGHLSNRTFGIPWVRYRTDFATLSFLVASAVVGVRLRIATRQTQRRNAISR